MTGKINVTIWNEYRGQRENDGIRRVYPDGIHQAIADGLIGEDDLNVRCATLDEPDCGLSDEQIAGTDVMLWWGHRAHNEVPDELVEKLQQRVLRGMGLIVLHSGHMSKIFRRLMGTSCTLKWREDGEREVLWTARPGHPILAGIGEYFILPQTEMYGEPFDIPEPDETVLISSFDGGEVFRSACTWRRGAGKVLYFCPGHETYPIYHDPNVKTVLRNAR